MALAILHYTALHHTILCVSQALLVSTALTQRDRTLAHNPVTTVVDICRRTPSIVWLEWSCIDCLPDSIHLN